MTQGAWARSLPRLGRSPGVGNGTPLQCSCLENPMDGGAWQAAVHGVAESDIPERRGTQDIQEPGCSHWDTMPNTTRCPGKTA